MSKKDTEVIEHNFQLSIKEVNKQLKEFAAKHDNVFYSKSQDIFYKSTEHGTINNDLVGIDNYPVSIINYLVTFVATYAQQLYSFFYFFSFSIDTHNFRLPKVMKCGLEKVLTQLKQCLTRMFIFLTGPSKIGSSPFL